MCAIYSVYLNTWFLEREKEGFIIYLMHFSFYCGSEKQYKKWLRFRHVFILRMNRGFTVRYWGPFYHKFVTIFILY